METISKSQIIEKIAQDGKITKTAAKVVIDATLEAIKAELVAGNKVALFGFGTFDIRERAAREGINPATKQKIQIAASKAVGFKATKSLKEAMNPKPAEKPAKKTARKGAKAAAAKKSKKK